MHKPGSNRYFPITYIRYITAPPTNEAFDTTRHKQGNYPALAPLLLQSHQGSRNDETALFYP